MKLMSAISPPRVHCTCVLTLVIKKPIWWQVGGIILSPPTIINLGTPRKFAGCSGLFFPTPSTGDTCFVIVFDWCIYLLSDAFQSLKCSYKLPNLVSVCRQCDNNKITTQSTDMCGSISLISTHAHLCLHWMCHLFICSNSPQNPTTHFTFNK